MRSKLRFLTALIMLLLLASACTPKPCLAPLAEGAPASLRHVDTVDGARIAVRDLGGTGAPLLLVTGYAATMDLWSPEFVAGLARTHRVLLLDNRGMGYSQAPAGAVSIAAMARDAAAVLDALGVSQADVLGWSMGGAIAQELALARPELVRALVLYATTGYGESLPPALDRMAVLSPAEFGKAVFPADWAASHPDALARLPRAAQTLNMDVVARQNAAMRSWNGTLDRLGSLSMPVLLLVGDVDWVCPPVQSHLLKGRLHGARMVILENAGHWMMHQYPRRMTELVDEFLNGQPAR